MTWTPESLAKAAASRKARAAERKQVTIDAVHGVERVLDTVKLVTPAVVIPSSPPAESWWKVAPLPEAITALAAMKREYDAAAAIVLARSTTCEPVHTCWTQLHKDIVPPNVQKLCKKKMVDGKQAFRDDTVFRIVDGLRIPDPQFCCNFACYENYQRMTKQLSALSRH